RDILARKIPFVLYKDIYAVAAIVGASLFYYMHKSGLNEMACIFLPITVTIIIRVLAPIYSLHLPKITNFEIKDDD
ncbi:TRIC cation channel family protein, partial [bacterium]|nr:TRIC cation channel family protein [bacterium]